GELQTLAGVDPALDATPVDLRAGTERAHAADLDLVASLDLARDDAFHRDAIGKCLLQLAGQVSAAAGDAFQHDRAGARAVVHDRGLDLVAFLERDLAARRVAELADV